MFCWWYYIILLTLHFVIEMSPSEMERITLFMMSGYGEVLVSYEEVAHLFNDIFPNRPPISKSTVLKKLQHFEETECCVVTNKEVEDPYLLLMKIIPWKYCKHFSKTPSPICSCFLIWFNSLLNAESCKENWYHSYKGPPSHSPLCKNCAQLAPIATSCTHVKNLKLEIEKLNMIWRVVNISKKYIFYSFWISMVVYPNYICN